ncbi:hypothetical protein H5410_026570 [Solanum commersonii]|uniref:Uncharacterized protein n=1 Tax=Solanum commersonii TaxID=4109 RepID=A0A9J5Z1W6_SOLCO|nr:hypothetical protein H5410_026570 [Solanum commersonii]
MNKVCQRQLRVGSASRRQGNVLPRMIPFKDRASLATWSKGQILASPGIKFPVDSVPTLCRAPALPFLLFSIFLQLRSPGMYSYFVLVILGKVEDVLPWVVGCSTFGDLGSVFSVINIVCFVLVYVCFEV